MGWRKTKWRGKQQGQDGSGLGVRWCLPPLQEWQAFLPKRSEDQNCLQGSLLGRTLTQGPKEDEG